MSRRRPDGRSREAIARGRADLLRTLALAALCAVAVALVRGRLFDQHKRIRETSDIFPLPPPAEVVVMSLGYRPALADVLWAHVLVSQGLHMMERRRYEHLTLFLDTINELDPTFRDPYQLADALITFNANKTPVEDVRKARAIMERGVKNRPLDAELWLGLGQFTAFIAPPTYLTDPAEQERWRVEGARMLARAAELSGDNASVAWQAIGAARYLGRAGALDAEISFLERTMVVTDDEELKDKLRARLSVLRGAQRNEDQADRFTRLEQGVWDMRHDDVPFVTRLLYVTLGPPRDPDRCAGAARSRDAACAASFREWEERSEAARAPR